MAADTVAAVAVIHAVAEATAVVTAAAETVAVTNPNTIFSKKPSKRVAFLLLIT